MHHDYTTVGHVTIDVLEDGSRRPGGSAFYAALQAARLGLRTRVLTRGRVPEVEQLLAPYMAELDVEVLPAERTTMLRTDRSGARRRQHVLAWAGEIGDQIELDTDILHLAPVARETPSRWRGRCALVGLTPQGLARYWEQRPSGDAAGEGAAIRLRAPDPRQREVAARCGALVLSEAERESCSALIAAALGAGGLVAVTAAGANETLLLPDGRELRLDAVAVDAVRDDIGAGDVFAAAFFVALHEGRQAPDAARFASAAAALRIEGAGADAVAERAHIEQRLRELRQPSQPP